MVQVQVVWMRARLGSMGVTLWVQVVQSAPAGRSIVGMGGAGVAALVGLLLPLTKDLLYSWLPPWGHKSWEGAKRQEFI